MPASDETHGRQLPSLLPAASGSGSGSGSGPGAAPSLAATLSRASASNSLESAPAPPSFGLFSQHSFQHRFTSRNNPYLRRQHHFTRASTGAQERGRRRLEARTRRPGGPRERSPRPPRRRPSPSASRGPAGTLSAGTTAPPCCLRARASHHRRLRPSRPGARGRAALGVVLQLEPGARSSGAQKLACAR